jgi:putative DNA primase/helicase
VSDSNQDGAAQASIDPDRTPFAAQPAADDDQHRSGSPFGDGWELDYGPAEEVIIEKTDWPFKCLGYDHGQYYFLSKASNQILHFPASGLVKANLRSIAPLEWWYEFFPKKDKKKNDKGELEDVVVGINWDQAVNDILDKSHKAGVFHADNRQRGCGVWAEKRGPLIHCGNKLIYLGQEYTAFDYESHFIYEAAPPRFRIAAKGLTTEESRLLYKICTEASWKDPKSGKILAGWIVASIVGGCLKWRPHIWIMGEKGSGKSWIITDVLTKVFGNLAFFLGAGSTEAGIRQSLQHDCLPVIMDEMEGESLKDSEILQSIITMSRRSSSGQRMAKGTADGIAQSFTLQSSFCFASINHSISQGADQSRISILESQKDERDPAIFSALDKLATKTLTPEYSERLLRRVIDDLPNILKNITTFMEEIREKMKDARASQQLAPLLAGIFSLQNGGLITSAAARKWLDKNDFKSYTATEAQKDCERAFDFLMTTRIRVIGAKKQFDVQIGKAISVALGTSDEEGYTNKEARAALDAIDIKVREYVWIRKPSQHISKIYKNTPWAISWANSLRLNDFIGASESSCRIGSGTAHVLIIDPAKFSEDIKHSIKSEEEIARENLANEPDIPFN